MGLAHPRALPTATHPPSLPRASGLRFSWPRPARARGWAPTRRGGVSPSDDSVAATGPQPLPSRKTPNAAGRLVPHPQLEGNGENPEGRGGALPSCGGDGRSPIAGKGGARPASGSAGSLPRPGSHPRCRRPPPVHLSPPSRSLTQRTPTEVLLVPQSHTSHSVRNEASNPAWPLPPPRGQVGGLWVLPTPPWAAEQCKAPAWDGGAGSVPARQRQLVPRRRTADPPPARASS